MNDLIILTALLTGPAYGYALKKTAGLIFGSGAMHNNMVYPSLKKFVRNGWVEQTIVAGDRGQQRKQYRITAAGRKHLLDQIGSFTEQEARDEGAFLLRVALFDALSKKTCNAIVAARKAFLVARTVELAQLHEKAHARSLATLALRRVQDRVKDELRWIRQIEGKLESNQGG